MNLLRKSHNFFKSHDFFKRGMQFLIIVWQFETVVASLAGLQKHTVFFLAIKSD